MRIDELHFNEPAVTTMKSTLTEIVDGRLLLPEGAMALLPAGTPLRMIIDPEQGTVCVFAKDPMSLSTQTKQMMDALADLSEGLTLEEYSAPVSGGMLRKHKLADDGNPR